MQWTVRRAGEADAEQIARINVVSWQHAYRGIVADAVLDRMLPASRLPGWRRWLARPDPGAVFVAVGPDGRVGAYCGVSGVRETEDAHDLLPTGELVVLCADPAGWASGAGQAVHQAGLRYPTQQGLREAGLGVGAANE